MSEFKGTPGPWFMEDGKDDGWIIAKDDALVCMMNAGLSHEEMSETEKHDSNLIMAAPELLEALMDAKEVCDVAADMTSCRADDDFVWNAQAKINAAIAKALGKS